MIIDWLKGQFFEGRHDKLCPKLISPGSPMNKLFGRKDKCFFFVKQVFFDK